MIRELVAVLLDEDIALEMVVCWLKAHRVPVSVTKDDLSDHLSSRLAVYSGIPTRQHDQQEERDG